jgi:hypothetical protein
MNLVCDEFINDIINVTEVGVYGGDTGKGICEYIKSKNKNYWITGVDNFKEGEAVRFPYNELIKGNSSEVYNQLEDESQHLIFIDGCHTFPMVVSDFFCYAPKVKIGGFIAFHDTGKHLDPLSGWQGVGDKNDTDMCLGGVRKALIKIGLFDNKFGGWELVMEDADVNDTGGGICVFKKLY